ncbi:helix-turn-helix domain-containing protein [Ornithinimicrobium sp. F0845]|uniref:helix-turn-helix domain-containing protein n=1 Tax=Ornithinimicrobium sp. F0845 TaxID=2926412 RepID=UPI001FF69FC0|nr:helix-turn-helix domain-containing protein [Ornithinimicrobium sp. F0845]MCK0111389.1 helix-turn-helix domain-containing protein [Ornithinimicrobium sp. F0845]
MEKRFLTLADVAETLNITMAQTKALVRSGSLPAVKIGGRGIWRVEVSMLEDYIERMYAETRETIARLTDEVDGSTSSTGGSSDESGSAADDTD